MKKHRLKKSVGIFAMLAVAVGLLAFSTVGATRAALTITSQRYNSEFNMKHIGITLLENGKMVDERDYVNYDWTPKSTSKELLSHIDSFKFGEKYREEIQVENSGFIDEYVILTIRKYWVGKDGKKRTDLDPALIHLNFVNIGDYWKADTEVIGKENPDKERTILMYYKPLKAKAEGVSEADYRTVPATDYITVDSAIKAVVDKSEATTDPDTGNTVIVTTYTYNGLKFVVEAEAEGVQTHNAEEAIHSAWGRQVTFNSDGTVKSIK